MDNASLDQSFPVFLWCVDQLNYTPGNSCISTRRSAGKGFGWFASRAKVHSSAASTAHMVFMAVCVHQGRATQSARKTRGCQTQDCSPCNPIWKNKVRSRVTQARVQCVRCCLSKPGDLLVVAFSTDYWLNHCSHEQRKAKILNPHTSHTFQGQAYLCPGVDKTAVQANHGRRVR